MNKSSENVNEPSILLFSGPTHVAGHNLMVRLLSAASGDKRDALELRYLAKSREVQSSGHRDEKEFVIALARETEAVAGNSDFRSVYRISKELSCGCKSFDDPVRGKLHYGSHPHGVW